MKKSHAIAAATIFAATVLTGCAGPNYDGSPAPQSYPARTESYPQSYPQPPQPYSSRYGVVDSIQASQMNAGNTGGIGAGAVVGGLVGGVLGNQVGGGRGKTAATVAGVVGGALVGNQVEQRNAAPARQMYQVGVRLDNGAYQTIMQDSVAELRVGSRVRIENERVYRY
jgi:outer membrane lipoprotein SlyB